MRKKTGQKHQGTTSSAPTVVSPTAGTAINTEFVIRDVRNNGDTAADADADDEEMNSGFYNYLRSSNGENEEKMSYPSFNSLCMFKC